MIPFLALIATFGSFVILPTTAPFRIIESQEDSITLKAFDKNFEQADLYAKSYCDGKDKAHILNISESRDYKVMTTLHDYKFDCIEK